MKLESTHLVGVLLLGAATLPAFACDLPKLPVIPAADQIGDQAPAINEATSAYFAGMRAYAECMEAALAAAGGDAAPTTVKAAFAARSKAAVAEAEAIQKLYQERFAAAGPTPKPGTEAALRKHIEGLAAGTPDYDAMTPDLARITRQQLADLQRDAAALGAIVGIDFRGASPQGADIFQVRGESGTTEARIGLDADGKTQFVLLGAPPVGNPASRQCRSPRCY